MFTEDTGHSFPRTMGTILAERVLDVVTIFVLLVVAALALSWVGDLSGTALFLGIASLLVLVGVAGILVMKRFGMRLARLLPNRFREAYVRFHEGAMGSFRQLPLLLFISLLTWLTEVGRLYFVIQSLDLTSTASFSLVVFVTLANAILDHGAHHAWRPGNRGARHSGAADAEPCPQRGGVCGAAGPLDKLPEHRGTGRRGVPAAAGDTCPKDGLGPHYVGVR